MEKPNYVLKANEAALVPKNEKSLLRKLRVPVWIIVGVIILGSLIFQDNLFGELSGTTQALFIAMAIGVTYGGGYTRVPTPFEIRFYDDYLIVYRDRHYYSKKMIRKEYDKFYYKDIKKCVYRAKTKRINIFGIVEGMWYKYNKDGSLPEKPTYHKTTNSMCYFYTSADPEVDFVSEIEKHSPIKVVVENH